MSIESFKELLLKKATDNPTLSTLISYIDDEKLADKVLESLEKMARPHASMGRFANAGVTSWASQLKNKDVDMLRDALSHHVSHHKAALKNGNRKAADQHLEKIVPLLHLAAKASAHSGGQLGFDYTPMEPWEANYTTTQRGENGKLKEGTKGLGRRPKNTDRNKNERGVPDYRYLEMAPHGGHPDQKNSKHSSGYPFEETQLGNPAKIDANEAYLHVSDPGAKESFTPHPFDTHPIHSVADMKQDDFSPEKIQQFANAMDSWNEGEHHKQYVNNFKEAHAKDPEAFKLRGKTKPEHHYTGVPLLEQPSHVARDTASLAPAATPVTETEQPAEQSTPSAKIDHSKLPPHLQAIFKGGK